MSLIDLASLVLAPTAVKDGKVYNAIPNDQDFTFSRGTEATRVNSAGLIEKARTNFLLQSNTFDTTWFAGGTISVTGGQSGYDSSSNAWLLDKTQANAHWRQNFTFDGSIVTYSLYVKAGSLNWVNLNYATTNSFFDLENGVVGVTTAIGSTIEDIGGGWYRCSAINNYSGGSSVRIYPADDDNDTSGTSGNILIQSAQLEQGLVSTDVITTTTTSVTVGITDDLPRVDYSGGGCPSLLLEPSRSNLIDDYSGYTWDEFNGASIAFNGNQQSPEGLDNAVTWTFSGTSGEVVQRSSITISNSTTYTISGYFKLTSGTLSSGSNQLKGLDGLAGANVSLNTLTSEWQRLSFDVTSSSTTGRVQLRCDDSATIQVYGLQLEAGSYVSSIIPSYGTSTSRSADSCSKTGISSLLNDSEGTLFAEIKAQANESTTKVITIGDGTSSNRVQIFYQAGTNITTNIIAGGSSQVTGFTTAVDQTQNAKVIIRYANNNAKFFLNGVEIASDTSVTTPTGLDRIVFNNGTGGSPFYGFNKQLIYFNSALTDDQCIALTK